MNDKLPCHVVQDLLPQYIDGLLSPESMELVRGHLQECDACRGIYEQMTAPEPVPEDEHREVDYLRKVRRSRTRLIAASALAVICIAAGSVLYSSAQAGKTSVNYDEGSRTVVVYGKEGDVDLELPETVSEAKNLDAQFESFRVSSSLDLLRTGDQPMDRYLSDYLNRTNRSLGFLRNYLKENCADLYPANRAAKYVDISILYDGDYSWTELEDRINIELGRFYWHREEVYMLALLGSRTVEWKQLGYAWYLGSCVDPYGEVLATTSMDAINEQRYADAYRHAGGSDELTPENYRKLNDAVSYVCLTEGMNWGSAYESYPLKDTALYKGPRKNLDPGNDMSVIMATSFIAYLVDQYGFDKVSAFCFGQTDFETAFQTDYGSAFSAWSARIIENCGE